MIKYTLYMNGNNINVLRTLGSIEVLESTVGLPNKIVATGTASMVALMYAKFGLVKTVDFFKTNFKALENLFSFDFFETDRGIMSRVESYRKINDFYTLIKSSSSIKNFNDLYALIRSDNASPDLGIEDISKINRFFSNYFSFLDGHMLPIPCYTSLFNVETAEEKIVSITTQKELTAAISITPFMGPVIVDGNKYISMQNIQGVSSPIKDRTMDVHLLLDTLSENGTPPFMSAMYILIAADYMGTIELKKRMEKNFSCDVNLWENPERLKTISFDKLMEEGFQTTEKYLKNVMKKL